MVVCGRYEVNPEYVSRLEQGGLLFVGFGDNGQRAEIVELKEHPYFVGVQYHPEFKTRHNRPSAPFLGLILAASVCTRPPPSQHTSSFLVGSHTKQTSDTRFPSSFKKQLEVWSTMPAEEEKNQ